jgi:hypothetical protein
MSDDLQKARDDDSNKVRENVLWIISQREFHGNLSEKTRDQIEHAVTLAFMWGRSEGIQLGLERARQAIEALADPLLRSNTGSERNSPTLHNVPN